MNLDDAKRTWTQHTVKLDSVLKLNLEALKSVQIDKSRSALSRYKAHRVFELLTGVVFAGLLGAYLVHHLTVPTLAIPALILDAFIIAWIAGCVRQLILLGQISFADPVATIQAKLEAMKLHMLEPTRLMILSLPLYFAYIVLGFDLLFGVNILAQGGRAFLYVNAAVSLVLFLPAIWVFRNLNFRNARHPVIRALINSAGGKQLLAAMDFLNQIENFKLDTEPPTPGGTIYINPLADQAKPVTAPAVPPTRVPPDPVHLAAQFPQLEIIELLGMGGMGMVYKARQPRLDRIVALKILPLESQPHPSFAERFNREAKTLAKLNHPGIVDVYDYGQTSQYYYFVMEYVDGMNLRRLLETRPLEPRQALELVVQVCTALQYAHDEGVVHRDIKPENILINKKGQVKIADFGLAKLLGTAQDTALTMSQAAMGTLNYMAPEQRQNAQGVDHRADIYSLGVVFYEMLTGEVPMGRFEPPSKRVQVDVRLDEVVLRALEREPARRYQHISEVKTNVETITSSMA